jgi:hypothetical protein
MSRRFDQPSTLDALMLLWGLAGYALIKLGGRIMRAGDDALDCWGDDL